MFAVTSRSGQLKPAIAATRRGRGGSVNLVNIVRIAALLIRQLGA